jgi:hypothetical protein
LTGYRDPECLQVLAAVHAEAHYFSAAQKGQARALTFSAPPDEELARRRLNLYRHRLENPWYFRNIDSVQAQTRPPGK